MCIRQLNEIAFSKIFVIFSHEFSIYIKFCRHMFVFEFVDKEMCFGCLKKGISSNFYKETWTYILFSEYFFQITANFKHALQVTILVLGRGIRTRFRVLCALFEEITIAHLSRIKFRALYESDESKKSWKVVKIQDGHHKNSFYWFSPLLWLKWCILKNKINSSTFSEHLE